MYQIWTSKMVFLFLNGYFKIYVSRFSKLLFPKENIEFTVGLSIYINEHAYKQLQRPHIFLQARRKKR